METIFHLLSTIGVKGVFISVSKESKGINPYGSHGDYHICFSTRLTDNSSYEVEISISNELSEDPIGLESYLRYHAQEYRKNIQDK